MAAALKLGEEDVAAVGKLREELQKAWAALTASQEKVPQPCHHHAGSDSHTAVMRLVQEHFSIDDPISRCAYNSAIQSRMSVCSNALSMGSLGTRCG